MQKIILPEPVKRIIGTLSQAGYEAYAVGGCVRDSILGRQPNDWDITTSATPLEVKELFRRTVDTGIQHGTVTILIDNEGFEVTTYRIDGEYEDSRHPKDVKFTASLAEDLARRDFTINAMAYNDEMGIVDLYDGIGDIQKKVIRAVGNPLKRFEEDALRILRAVRFAAQLGYSIDEDTRKAIGVIAPNLEKISAERIQTELVKLVTSENPDFFRMVYETGITAIIMPEFDRAYKCQQNHPHHVFGVGEHCVQSMLYIKNDKALRLTMLLHDMGKPECKSTDDNGINHFYGHAVKSREIAREIMARLKFDNDTRDKVVKLTGFHDIKIELTEKSVRRAVNKVGEDLFLPLLEVKKADSLAQNPEFQQEKLKILDELLKIYQVIVDKNQCVSLKSLAVKGSDLINAGMKPGKEIGEKLNEMLDYVLDNPEDNNKEFLLKTFL